MNDNEKKEVITEQVQDVTPKKSKGTIYLIIIFLLLVVIGLGAYFFVFKKDGKLENEEKKVPENKLVIYMSKDEKPCMEKSDVCNLVMEEINVNTKDAKIVDMYYNYLLISDDVLKIYDVDTKEMEEINVNTKDAKIVDMYYNYLLISADVLIIYDVDTKKMEEFSIKDEYDKYNLVGYEDSYNNHIIQGIGLYKGEFKDFEHINLFVSSYSGFYDLESKKILLEGKYNYYFGGNKNYVVTLSFNPEIENLGKAYVRELYRLNDNKKVMISESGYCNIVVKEVDNHYYFGEICGDLGIGVVTVYTENNKQIIQTDANLWDISKDGNVYVSDGKTITAYDSNGNFLNKSNPYDSVEQIGTAKGELYYFYIKDSKLYLNYKDVDTYIETVSDEIIVSYAGCRYISKTDTSNFDYDKEGFYVNFDLIEKGEVVTYYIDPSTFKITK